MDYARLKTEYLCYLMDRAGLEAEGGKGYLTLCEIMQSKTFLPIMNEMDENRCGDCRRLRQDFAQEYDERDGDILDGLYGENGTMLELMIVLAEKMAYNLAESQYEANTRKWILEMMENCGLSISDNEAFEDDPEGERDRVDDILDAVIFRKIGWDGEGGFFPLQCPRNDQRCQELIIQMNNYIEENYDIC